MSYQPPPPPPGYSPPPPGYGAPPPKPGHAAELIVGAVLGGVLVLVSGFVGLMLLSITENGAIFFVGTLLGLVLPIVLAARPATKWWGIGLLIGFFLTLIVLGGACVALIASVGG
jgi:hypothetical protein